VTARASNIRASRQGHCDDEFLTQNGDRVLAPFSARGGEGIGPCSADHASIGTQRERLEDIET
jgi:hypothetical protein